MRAAIVARTTGPSGVELVDLAEPAAEPGTVEVEIRAAGVSFPDLLLSQGRYQIQPELPFALGTDFCGILREDVPEQALRAGERVAGVLQYGAAAEWVRVSPLGLCPVPESLSDIDAAAMPLAYLTAHFALLCRGGARRGDRILVTGAAGSVGLAAVQVGKAIGARVVALVRSEADRELLLSRGADAVVAEASAAKIREAAGGGIDIAMDVVGSDDVVLESLRSLHEGGRLLTVGYAGGSIPTVKLNRLLLGNIEVRGASWGPYTRAHPGFMQVQWREIMRWLAEGRIATPDVQVFPLEDAAAALATVAGGGVRSRIVLEL
ncbi:NADPH:quinone oxidoreductase family protein [Gulosibacter chungangensis]|uniref:NADPH:quinone oxidoreductase family protein n=1 Tax=Gulosibacter chungangensis TaxID=979746 RepID=A0A7J5BFT7_9MICO|nr:NADPH:quinone oxidoreductase family protein [Gulosibacter chungangensis]KAB1645146.1 NADPH:quinone oxidoreductase family protein [Gulosibacter chungangensis]